MGVRILSAGTCGPEVKAVQQGLNLRGTTPRLEEDGVFGPQTDRAVRDFQGEHGLKVDGIIGPRMRKSLFWIGVATVTVVGRRDPKVAYLRPRNAPDGGRLRQWHRADDYAGLIPEHLQSSSFDELYTQVCSGLSASTIRHRHVSPLALPVPMPALPDWRFKVTPLRPSASARSLELVYDHVELAPGEQSMVRLRGERQEAFVLTMQSIYRRRPDDGPAAGGVLAVQVGAPFLHGPWTLSPFIQLTDVDRLAAMGAFHHWRPYAQPARRPPGPGPSAPPPLAADLFPVHLTVNRVRDSFSLSLGAGFTVNLDLASGRIQAGPKLPFALTVELGHADGR